MDWKLGRLTALAVCSLALMGCDDRKALAETTVRAALKDPDSAKFGPEMKLYGPKDNFLACGTVNAKNGYGGYVGYVPFMISGVGLHLGTEETSAFVEACCDGVYEASKRADGKGLALEVSSACAMRGSIAGFVRRS